MINGKIMKWGNSYGLRISKNDFENLNLGLNQEVTAKIEKRENPLKELFGAFKDKPISRKKFLEHRKELEGDF